MTGKKSNLPASVAARLLNRAKQTGDDYQILLTGYCFERFLYRLGAFLLPILEDLRRGERREGTWRVGGPWQ